MIADSVQAARLKLDALAKLVGGTRIRGSLKGECTGIALDSRRVRPGTLFVAAPGTVTDGALFVQDAIARGAVAVMAEERVPTSRQVPLILVENARRAMAIAACELYGHPSRQLRTVGVTGTNGKTSVTHFLHQLLARAGHSSGLLGTLGYHLGKRELPAARTTPEAPELQAMLAELVRAECDSVVMEVSSHALAQDRVFGTEFDIGVFTNLSIDHLDFHRTMEDYFETKALLFGAGLGYTGDDAGLVLNIDDSWGRKLALRAGVRERVVTYGVRPEARVRAEEVQLHAAGVEFELVSPWGSAPVQLNLLGRYNVSNALAAFSAGGLMGLDFDGMVEAMKEVAPVPGRLESIPNDRRFLAFVDYAHTEDALANVLRTLREICDQKLIVVFGCGGDRDRGKRSQMGAAAVRWADVVVLTSDNPRTEDPEFILDEIEAGCEDSDAVKRVPDRREAIEQALGTAAPGDIVLVAGKGHETMQQIGNTMTPFDDREVVRAWFERGSGA